MAACCGFSVVASAQSAHAAGLAVPTGVEAKPPAAGKMLIFWNAAAGATSYNIYRSTDPDLPKDKWIKLNSELLTKTTYQDEKVEPVKRYYYYLTAVDRAGNVSPPSEVVSETVP